MKREEKFNDYEGFVKKFEPKKTTDDCFTPQDVYDAVLGWVGERLTDLRGREVVRPFWPGGDYENYDYPENCVVVDNPPFSQYVKIVRYYVRKGIDFFLFAPALTLFNKEDCTFVITGSSIMYENGAVVNTGFATNMAGDVRVWTCPELSRRISAAVKNRPSKPKSKYSYPIELITSAILRKTAPYAEFKVRKCEAFAVSNLDGQRTAGRGVYGGAFLISERAAAERAAAERAAAERAAAERAAANTVQLSERERAIVEDLSRAGLRPQTDLKTI